MEPSILALILAGSLLLVMGLGLPVAFSLGGLSLAIGFFIWGGTGGFYAVVLGALGKSASFTLTAIPLFLMMAAVLRFTGMADDMYEMINRWMGKIKGGLALGTVVISSIFAAMVGISTVATATLGLTAMPAMFKRGYNRKLVAGAICAGGALGIIIPPSVIMIIYAAEAEVSAGQMFFGGVIPGIIMAILFMIYIALLCIKYPSYGPPVEENFTLSQKMESLRAVMLPMFIILLVLGVIYTGIATTTEAAAIGLVGSIICAAIKRAIDLENIKKMMVMGVGVNAMVFWIILGAVAYSRLVTMTGVGEWFSGLVTGMDVNRWIILLGMQAIFFVLGMFLDPAGIILITGPFFLPVVGALGFDPLWYGVMFVVNMCMAYITPPFGFNLFVIRAVAPAGLTIGEVYAAIWPFVALMALTLLIIALFPQTVTWLPSLLIK
ncbi:TRAP transporter large permease [Desulfoscipio gibsoniae]